MRASRLVTLLLLLQDRGRMTAQQLAEELEVSVRTVYRDVEALSTAGIPLYGDAGHAGGYRLVDGYRTRLTGLTEGEARAAFLAAVPGAAAELGLGEALAAAQLKLRAALPEPLREHAGRIQERFLLDAPGWYGGGTDRTPHLSAVAAAVWERRALLLRYRRWRAPEEIERRVEPYGLVLKAGRWYLVAAGPSGLRTYRVDQILGLRPLEKFAARGGFDLAAYWTSQLAGFRARLYTAEALVRLTPEGARRLGVTPTSDGWTEARIPIESIDHAHGEFLRLGTDIDVMAPTELRDRIAATVRALAARYTG